MSYYPKTVKELKDYLNKRIDDQKAEIEALEAITINTSHKTLTNRAVTGATIRTKSYSMNGEKELSYGWKGGDTGHAYQSNWIDLGEYTGEVVGYVKQQRTITPTEAAERVATLLEARRNGLAELENDLANAESNVAEFNAAIEALNTLDKKLTWASRSVLTTR